MLDILDSIRKSMALSNETKLNIDSPNHVNKAIAMYKLTSGNVSHSKQLFLDQSYVNKLQSVSNVPEVTNKRIGVLINIYV